MMMFGVRYMILRYLIVIKRNKINATYFDINNDVSRQSFNENLGNLAGTEMSSVFT